MSSLLLGDQARDRLPLAGAVDSLGAAARAAGAPGMIWLAGVSYPGLNFNVDLVRALFALGESTTGVDIPGASGTGSVLFLFGPRFLVQWLRDASFVDTLAVLLLCLPLFLVLARLVVGLAKVSDPTLWRPGAAGAPPVVESGLVSAGDFAQEPRPRLRHAWRAGRRLGLKALGLWGMLLGLLVGAAVVLVGPAVILVQRVVGSADLTPLVAGLLLPPMALLLVYAVVLMVVNQLALHSLAHNRRGVSSALTHAWRLVRASPASAARATCVDLVLAGSVVVLHTLASEALQMVGVDAWSRALLVVPVYAFAGVTRAGYWARAYRSLGGLSASDHVPGL